MKRLTTIEDRSSFSCDDGDEEEANKRKEKPAPLDSAQEIVYNNRPKRMKTEVCTFHTVMSPQHFLLVLLLIVTSSVHTNAEGNSWERPANMPRIQGLEVMCGAQHMEVHLTFDSPFHGLVASKGMYGHPNCIYVPPRSGQSSFVFNINYEQCGTKPDNHGKFYENTIVVQYDEELIEAWDEAKRLRCEWFNDYEKTATKTSPMVISDLEIVELNFHGDNVDCWMEIQEGKGPWAPPLTGIVPLGSPLTMVIAVKDPTGEFDMRVKACEASDGQNGHVLPLSDPEGCILRPKLIGKFSKIKLDDGRATVLTYAFLSAFKFPDMLNVHVRCTVEICRHGCPDHCSPHYVPAGTTKVEHNEIAGSGSNHEPEAYESSVKASIASPPNEITQGTPKSVVNDSTPKPFENKLENEVHMKQQQQQQQQQQPDKPQVEHGGFPHGLPPPPHQFQHHPLRNGPLPPPPPPGRPYFGQQQRFPVHANRYPLPPPPPGAFQRQPLRNHPGQLPPPPRSNGAPMILGPPPSRINNRADTKETLPEDIALPRMGEAAPAASDAPQAEQGRSLGGPPPEQRKGETSHQSPPASGPVSAFPKGPRKLRLRRSISSNNGVIGIEGAFKVVSEADLNFALNSNLTGQPTTVVLKGSRMARSGDTVYGICLPRFGFGLVFFGLGLATLVAILTAIFLAYAHYVIKSNNQQKNIESYPTAAPPAPTNMHTFQGYQNAFPIVILRKMW